MKISDSEASLDEQSASLPGSANESEHVLTTRHLTRLAGRFARFQRLGRLRYDALRGRRIFLEVLGEAMRYRVLDKRANLGVAELRLRLTLRTADHAASRR